jgi:hypothetical protein
MEQTMMARMVVVSDQVRLVSFGRPWNNSAEETLVKSSRGKPQAEMGLEAPPSRAVECAQRWRIGAKRAPVRGGNADGPGQTFR